MEALEARGLQATHVAPGDSASSLTGAAAWVVQTDPEIDREAFTRTVLAPARAASCLVVPVLDRLLPATRDRLLIAGAADVCPEGDPDDLAARVEAALLGWMRTGPRRPLNTAFKAQRGRQTFDISVIDIDPGGVALSNGDVAKGGELLRLALPLPDGPLVVWGRVGQSEGGPGIRFLGLSMAERRRIANAVQGRTRQPGPRDSQREATPVPPEASRRPSTTPVAPAVSAPPPPPVAMAVAVGGAGASAAPVVSPREETPLGLDITVDLASVAAEPVEVTDADVEEIDAPDPTTASEEDRAVEVAGEEAPSDTPQTSAVDSIAEAIGELLSDGSDVTLPPLAHVPEGTSDEPEPEAPLRRWPEQLPNAEDVGAELETAVALGLVSAESPEGFGDRILEFARDLTPLERRAWDEEPPEEALAPELLQRQLVLRLRFHILLAEGHSLPAPPEARWEIDEELLRPLRTEANELLDEIQQLADEFVAAGELHRMKELHPLRTPLTRALDELRAVVDRLQGVEIDPALGRLPLDVEERSPDEEQPVRRSRKASQKAQKTQDVKDVPIALPRRGKSSRTFRRVAIWCVLLAALLAVYVYIQPERAKRVGAEVVGDVAGVMDVVVIQDKATIQMNPGWVVDSVAIDTMRRNLQQKGIDSVLIVGHDGRLIAAGKSKSPLRIVGR